MGFEPTTPTLARPRAIGQVALFWAFFFRKLAGHTKNTLLLRANSASPISYRLRRFPHVVGVMMPVDALQRRLAH